MEIVKTASLFSVAELQHAKLRDTALSNAPQDAIEAQEDATAHTQANNSVSDIPGGTSRADPGEAILMMNAWDSAENTRRSLTPGMAIPSGISSSSPADTLAAYASYILGALH